MSPVELLPSKETIRGISPAAGVGLINACRGSGGVVLVESMVNGKVGDDGLTVLSEYRAVSEKSKVPSMLIISQLMLVPVGTPASHACWPSLYSR